MVVILWLIEKNVQSVPVIEIGLRCLDFIFVSMIILEKQNGFRRVGCVINATMLFLIDFFSPALPQLGDIIEGQYCTCIEDSRRIIPVEHGCYQKQRYLEIQ